MMRTVHFLFLAYVSFPSTIAAESISLKPEMFQLSFETNPPPTKYNFAEPENYRQEEFGEHLREFFSPELPVSDACKISLSFSPKLTLKCRF